MSYCRAWLLGIVTAILAACDVTGPHSGLATRIDHVSSDSSGLQVSFTVTNMGPRAEELSACGGRPLPGVEKRQANSWESFAGGICLAIFSTVPISLLPGDIVSGTTGASRAEPGVYRLVWSYAADGSARAVSDPFTVR